MDLPRLSVLPRLASQLEQREKAGALRVLPSLGCGIDFSSNDYLGIARDAMPLCEAGGGATGSRLISGNSEAVEELESQIAEFHGFPSALIFNSGYDANLGLLSALASRHDTYLYDELAHASMRDGIRLSLARSWSFRHNDSEDLRKKLRRSCGPAIVVVESIYSMDGDSAPLCEFAACCAEFGALMIVDEAHSVGIRGSDGRGMLAELNLLRDGIIQVVTFGKAFGAHGAAVLGPPLLKQYLINFARSFMYSTALPASSIAHIKNSYTAIRAADDRRAALASVVVNCEQSCAAFDVDCGEAGSHIKRILTPGNQTARAISSRLRSAGYDIVAIRHPTVPRGAERLRLSLHSFNSAAEIAGLLTVLSEVR